MTRGVTSDAGAAPATVFAALSDETRLAILTVIARRGETTASELAGVLPVSRQAIGKHLGILETAGLIRRRSAGRHVWFRVRPDTVRDAGAYLASLAASWDDRFSALRVAAESSPGT